MNLAAATATAVDMIMLGAQANVQTNIPGLNEDADENAETNPGELLSGPGSVAVQTVINGLTSRELLI